MQTQKGQDMHAVQKDRGGVFVIILKIVQALYSLPHLKRTLHTPFCLAPFNESKGEMFSAFQAQKARRRRRPSLFPRPAGNRLGEKPMPAIAGENAGYGSSTHGFCLSS